MNMLPCMNKKNIRYKTVVTFSLILSFLFFFYHFWEMSALFYLGLVALAIGVFLFTEKESFLVISFLIPNLFMFKQIDTESAILGYVFLLLSVRFLIKNFNTNNKVNIFLALHIVFTLLTCFFYDDMGLLTSLIRFSFNFCLFSYCANLFVRDCEVKQVIRMYLAGVLLAILMGIIFHYTEGDLYSGYFAGIGSGRNYFGAVVSPAITIIILYFLEKKVTVFDVALYSVTAALCLISIVLSGSRTSVICLLIPIGLVIFCFVKSFFKFNFKLVPLIIVGVIIGVFVFSKYDESVAFLLERFEDSDVKTGNNRFTLWVYYIDEMTKNLWTCFIGSGSIDKVKVVEHNTVVQCLYELGIMGFATLVGAVTLVYKKFVGENKLSLVSFFPLIAVILPYMGINGLYGDQLSYLLVLCALIMKDFSKTKVTKIEGNVDQITIQDK